ncbi:hypothetical protein BGX28_010460 [Mortierella sp. GBA30]|nr:hypothetical protein BGX28_010460 [Mortierella sp. GBA30]
MAQQANRRLLNIVAIPHSISWLPEHPRPRERPDVAALANGFFPKPQYDLKSHGGRTLRNMSFQLLFLNSTSSTWTTADFNSITSNLSAALQDTQLNSVIQQYFPPPDQPITTDPQISRNENLDLTEVQFADVTSFVTSQHAKGALKGPFESRVFCLLLPPKARLYGSGGEDSHNGLAGYHGSVDCPRDGGETDTVYFAVAVYSEEYDDSTGTTMTNGIPVFDQPWKNVVATLYHELVETRTDPDVQNATGTSSNVLGWYSDKYGEIGDIPILEAESGGLAGLNRVFLEVERADGNGTVPIQLMYSNRDHGPSAGD